MKQEERKHLKLMRSSSTWQQRGDGTQQPSDQLTVIARRLKK